MRRSGLSWSFVLCCALGCNGGPTTDWPGKHSENDGRGPSFPSRPVPGGTATGGSAPGGAGAGTTPGGVAAGAGGAPAGTVGGAMSPPSSGGASPGAVGGGGTTGAVPGGTGALGGLLGGTTGGGGYLAGGSPGGAVDAGAPPLVDAGSADSGAEVEAGIDDADAGPSDGGVEAGPAADAGLCPTESPARVDGGCQGSYCNLTVDGLAALALPAGACSGEATLQLVCDAQLAHKTAQCAQENVLSLSLDSAVRSCLRRDPQLAQVAGACVDCYVAELICTLSNCLATCVAGFDVACTSCRREHCGQEFTRCSGLPSL